MNHVIHLGITAENPNLIAGERFNFALKSFILYALPLGRILPNQNETETHSNQKECVQLEGV